MELGGKAFLLVAKVLPETPGRLAAHAYSYEAMTRPAAPRLTMAPDFGAVGQYALQFEWTDGHHTGIFSFDYLRDIADGRVK